MSTLHVCPNCFEKIDGKTVCPYCRYNTVNGKKYSGVLPTFTYLNNKYIIGRVLGRGGFGITYSAAQIKDNHIIRRVAIKEFMPVEYSSRADGTKTVIPFDNEKAQKVFSHGKEKYKDEARTLITFIKDPVVVNILDFFEENNTAYIVMEFLDGEDLRDLANESGGRLEPAFALTVFTTLAKTLLKIHKKGVLHRDISPDNIFCTKTGQIKLIDFGAARNYVSAQNVGMSVLLKRGYAPPEQYNRNSDQGTWSDVYALCATYYKLASGNALADSMFRCRGQHQPPLHTLGCGVSKKMSDIIEKGIALDVKDRYKNFAEVLADMGITSGEKTASPSPSSKTKPSPQTSKQRTPLPSTPTPLRTPMPPKKQLYIGMISGKTITKKMFINKNDVFKIGRSKESCQYVLEDGYIGRIHCYIQYDGTNIVLVDNTSKHGTFLKSGKKLEANKQYKIKPGTQFYPAKEKHMLVIDFQK